MKITFSNNGLPYSFSEDSCGGGKHLVVQYREVVSIEIVSSASNQKSGGFFGQIKTLVNKIAEKFVIVITYYPTWHDKTKTAEKIIAIAPNEVEQAKMVVSFVQGKIAERQNQARIDAERIELAKKTDTVEVIDLAGRVQKVWKRQTYFSGVALIAEGGTAYHTHADCYESWKSVYQRSFKRWSMITLEDAKRQGYTPCQLCEKYYDGDIDEDDAFDFGDE